jgi:LytS/YehU family sensor histidine kinase
MLLTVFLTTFIRARFDGQYEGELISAFTNMVKMVYPLIVNGFLMYWLVLIILLVLDFYKRYRDQYTFSVELESKLTKSQLQTLKMQLQPHFLFNAMNTISMMIRRKKDKEAIEMISGLSDMLRSSLAKEGKQMVPLSEEIELLKKYLKVEQVRFQDTLKIIFNMEESAMKELVPSLLLQPIVENAFKHGVSKSIGNCRIEIGSYIEQEKLNIKVYNTGPSLPENMDIDSCKGIGLKNTKSRLEQLYGAEYQLSITNQPEGTLVEIVIPLIRTAA